MRNEAYQPLPSRPASSTLAWFAHYDPQGVVDPYVVHYLEALHNLGATIIFVSTSATLTSDSIDSIRPLCAGIYTRENLSFDFGSWHSARHIMRNADWSLHDFDRLVLTNDSVYGPLFPLGEMWDSFHSADMYGAVECCPLHLQSWFLVWDLNPRTRRFLRNFWGNFEHVADKRIVTDKYEAGMTVQAREAHLEIKPFLTAAQVDAACEPYGVDHWDDPDLWGILIKQLRFPFLKTKMPRTLRGDSGFLQFIDQHTDYPSTLIQSNINRLSACVTG